VIVSEVHKTLLPDGVLQGGGAFTTKLHPNAYQPIAHIYTLHIQHTHTYTYIHTHTQIYRKDHKPPKWDSSSGAWRPAEGRILEEWSHNIPQWCV